MLELCPRSIAQSFFHRLGETGVEARRRILFRALPMASAPILLLTLDVVRTAREDGWGRAVLTLGVALAVVAVLVGVMFLAHARRRVRLAGGQLEERTLGRTRRHPAQRAHRAVSHHLVEARSVAPTTFVVDEANRCLIAMSWVHFERQDIEDLLRALGVAHEVALEEHLGLRQMRRRYPGAFTFSRRHPAITGFLALIPLLAVVVGLAVLLG